MTTSEELYDKFAPHFRSYSKKKDLYLESIDRLVLNNLPKGKLNVLDVGCGDGVRGIRLFQKMKGQQLLMIDNSSEMVKLARKFENKVIKAERIDISAQRTKLTDQYGIILCLWNVLGHIPSQKHRLRALINMKSLLREQGKIFIDISNRYNIAHYGLKKVANNIINDLFKPSPKNGDFSYKINIGYNKQLDSSCHFFSPFEIKNLTKTCELSIEKECFIDYATGKTKKSFFGGHLFYILRKPH